MEAMRAVTIFRENCTVLGVIFHSPLDCGLYLAVSSRLLPREFGPQDREMNVEIILQVPKYTGNFLAS